MGRRVVLTGIGTVNPLGNSEEFWENLVNGKSGVGLVSKFDATNYRCELGGEVHLDYGKFGIESKEVRKLDSFSLYALAASKLALEDSGLELGNRNGDVGVIIGTGVGGIETIERENEKLFNNGFEKGPKKVSPFLISGCIPNAACVAVSIKYGFEGPSFSVNSACASGLNGIISAAQNIMLGDAEVFVTGGTDAPFVKTAYASFANMRALAKGYEENPERASRPFDALRSGFVVSEGAGIVILENLEYAKKRNAKIYAELVGYGMTSDAGHITSPREDGEGMRRAMEIALAKAGVNPDEVDYINAHGTSTLLNDKTETLAIKRLFGEQAYKIPISSTKSMTGHLLGGAGGLETVICALAMGRGVIPPTINYENPDPDCDLDYTPNKAKEANINVVMNNNFGFGGHNTCIVLKKYMGN